jgi:predicted MFS family arabinose efflux permease
VPSSPDGLGDDRGVLGAYRPLFQSSEARRLVAASLTGRLPIALFDLPLILLAQQVSGSFAVAGIAVGVHAGAIAISAPFRGRLVDRRGARTALPPLVVANALAIGALPLAAGLDAAWLIVVVAGIEGVTAPPIVASMRLEWQRLLGREDERLAQAYAFESVAQVSLFVVGSLLAAAAIALVGASAALAVTAAIALVGGLAFALLARTGAQPPVESRSRLGPVRIRGVRTLAIATALADVGLGTVDVAVVAFAQQRGESAAAGVLLAIFAASSLIAGALYGARRWRSPPERRVAILLGLTGATLILLAAADSLLVLGLLLIVAGIPSTAQWATMSLALDRVAPPDSGAEAYNWLSSANAAGVALGGVIAGVAIEVSGTTAAFLAGAGVVLVAAVFTIARRRDFSRGELTAG